MNPILPLNAYVADGEPHRMPDGRLYLYGSWDIADRSDYCSDCYHVFSTDDMIRWTDHGESFRLPDGGMLYAPDCLSANGKYYLYYCMPGGKEGTAVSEAPWGPFTDPQAMELYGTDGIDPSVFMDDDGQAYYFWGQFSLNGARLNADMRSIDPSTIVNHVLTEEDHGFHEGSSIRKINGTYYLIYTDITRGRATSLSYATSPSPLGPYTKQGVIIDNTGCDPNSWNNHGSIECFDGQWYIFYHRSSRNGKFSRRMNAERITIAPDGSIREAEQTVGGAEGPVDAFRLLEASRASLMRGGAYVCTDEKYGERLTACAGSVYWNGFIEYRYLDFKDGASAIILETRGHGTIHVRQSSREDTCEIIADSAEFCEYRVEHAFRGGVHPLRLFIESAGMDIRSIRFE